MKLADLDLAQDLAAELRRLDEIAGPAELQFRDTGGVIVLEADEVAEFVAWKRGTLYRRLAELGVEIPGVPQTIEFEPAAGPPPLTDHPRSGFGAGAINPPQTERVAEDRRQPAMPPHPTEMAAAREVARERVLGPVMKAYGRPQSSDPDIIREWEASVGADLAHLAERRRDEIEGLAQELVRGPMPRPGCAWADCPLEATTVVGGRHYCSPHAGAARSELRAA